MKYSKWVEGQFSVCEEGVNMVEVGAVKDRLGRKSHLRDGGVVAEMREGC